MAPEASTGSPIGWADATVIAEQNVLTNVACFARRPLRAGNKLAASSPHQHDRIVTQAWDTVPNEAYQTGATGPEARIGRHNLNQTIEQGN